METTRLSTKGRVVLPKSILEARRWAAGTEFTVEETPEGVLLRPARRLPRTTPDQVAGCLRWKGKPVSLAQMDKAIGREVKRRHDLGRYLCSHPLLTKGDTEQYAAAKSLFAAGPVWICKAVLFETE